MHQFQLCKIIKHQLNAHNDFICYQITSIVLDYIRTMESKTPCHIECVTFSEFPLGQFIQRRIVLWGQFRLSREVLKINLRGRLSFGPTLKQVENLLFMVW